MLIGGTRVRILVPTGGDLVLVFPPCRNVRNFIHTMLSVLSEGKKKVHRGNRKKKKNNNKKKNKNKNKKHKKNKNKTMNMNKNKNKNKDKNKKK